MALPVTDYHSAVAALFARTAGHIKPGLSRTEGLLTILGDPHRRVPAFHVAGTNGKGSVCATLDALLRARGLRVGRYTSPHLVDFRERILIDGVPIAEAEVLDFLRQVESPAAALGATFFEITTVMAFWHFATRGADVAVIETGLGGRYDSTNVVDPVVATVTNVAMDHMEYLGTTLPEIADEKAGIFKEGRPAVIGETPGEVVYHLATRAMAQGVSSITLAQEEWPRWDVTIDARGTAFTAVTPYGESRFTTPLIGDHQTGNAVTALATVWAAGDRYRLPTVAAVNDALAHVTLPGRFQRVGSWIFDVAHNPAGVHALAGTLAAASLPGPVTALVGVLGDKDWRGMLDALGPVVDSMIVTQPASAPAERAWDPVAAGVYASQRGVPVTLEVNFDLALLRAQESGGTTVVVGSFHTVGDAMFRLGIDPLATAST